MAPPQSFTVWMVLGRWWSVPGFIQTSSLEPRPNCSILILVSRCLRVLQVLFLKTPAFFSWERLPSGWSAMKPSDCSVFSCRTALGRVLAVPNIFHFRIMEATVLLRAFNAADMFSAASVFFNLTAQLWNLIYASMCLSQSTPTSSVQPALSLWGIKCRLIWGKSFLTILSQDCNKCEKRLEDLSTFWKHCISDLQSLLSDGMTMDFGLTNGQSSHWTFPSQIKQKCWSVA